MGILGNDIDMIGLDFHVVISFQHGDLGAASEQLGQLAFVLGIKVLDQHERHARLFGQVDEKFAEGFVSAGGGANADDRERLADRSSLFFGDDCLHFISQLRRRALARLVVDFINSLVRGFDRAMQILNAFVRFVGAAV